MPGLVTFLSDFGLADPFVGLCHVAVLAQAPEARIVDLGHEVAPQNVRQGAARLADAVAHVPEPATHLAVVDPGVGSARHALVLVAGGHRLVGPDNGLLLEAAERLGGVAGAWALVPPAEASATFHGRDVFAPAAGRLAAGAAPGALAQPLDPETLVTLPSRPVHASVGRARAGVRDLDRYGNVQLALPAADLDRAGIPSALRVRAGDRVVAATRVRTFAELAPGRAGVLVDSFGWAAVVVAGGSAAAALEVVPDDEVELVPG
ncbi:hypothetical protein ER308_12585 [Egibacter rhizosphaerae]|uniref:SAM-dependent chlorinase/fluorinase n=1 Tax=Egibacter rhizosphaerae TaxID=1670831 RepID=A0A411YGM6_9ACTN|nr:SAM-dependent chlorinase/fluorinase [Egibacter rhizosphaerae]QBI20319.1 hypothetical protein ER308_12585 [Egibacter rhizosphaerae]